MTLRCVAILCGSVFLAPACLFAQTLPRTAAQPSDESIAPTGNAQSTGLLTQADVTSGPGTTQVGLQAGDFFITGTAKTGYAKIYLRTTVPLTQDTTSSATASASSGSSGSQNNGAGSGAAASKLSAAATSALLDPYGGVMNLSGGYLRRIGPPAHGRDSNGNKSVELDNEGLFVDGRFGLKFINLPDQSTDSTKIGGTSVSPFAAASLALRFAHSVYNESYQKAEGLFEGSVAVVTNIAADTSLSSAFQNGLLARRTWALSLSVAFQVSGNLAVTITGSPASGNGSLPELGRNYQVGVKVLNSSSKS